MTRDEQPNINISICIIKKKTYVLIIEHLKGLLVSFIAHT